MGTTRVLMKVSVKSSNTGESSYRYSTTADHGYYTRDTEETNG